MGSGIGEVVGWYLPTSCLNARKPPPVLTLSTSSPLTLHTEYTDLWELLSM